MNKTVFFLLIGWAFCTQLIAKEVIVFKKENIYAYRIPSLLYTQKGTLLAVAERRIGLHDHAQNDIVLKRSLDKGKTWTKINVIADYEKESLNDPILVQLNTGRILLIFQQFPYGIHARSDGWIQIADTGYDGPRNTHSFLTYSDDDGITWATPKDITKQIRPHDNISVGSPGIAIQIKKGSYKGRIILPLYLTQKVDHTDLFWNNAVAWSDNNGTTWHVSNDIKHKDKNVCGNEAQVAETKDGLIMVARTQRGLKHSVCYSKDGGLTWSLQKQHKDLPGTPCMGSLLRYEKTNNKDLLLHSAVANLKKRKEGTIRYSKNNGRTWHSRKFKSGTFKYSCLTQMENGKIGILFEGKNNTIRFDTFTLDWVEGRK